MNKTHPANGVRKLLIREQIAAEVRRRIAQGEYAAGAFMPTARDLAREFATSRTTIGHALDALRDAGLVEMTQGRGTRVLSLTERPSLGAVAIFYIAKPPFVLKPAMMIEPMQAVLRAGQQHAELICGPEPIPEMTPDEIVRRFSGALFVEGLGYEATLGELARRKFPFVVANLEKAHDVPCTWVDHRKITLTAVRLLAALGHRRIALLMRPRKLFFYDQAFSGYQAGLEEAGLAFDPALILVVERLHSPVDPISAYLQMRDFLPAHPDVTAIVACRDYLAGGACRAIAEAGKTVGRDLSVIGFDDTTWPQEPPFLTTFMEPMEALGSLAARMLMEQLTGTGGPLATGKREVEAPLVLRRSVGPCPSDDPATPPLRFLMQPWEAP